MRLREQGCLLVLEVFSEEWAFRGAQAMSDCQTEVVQRAEGPRELDGGRWSVCECGPTVVELAVKTCGCAS